MARPARELFEEAMRLDPRERATLTRLLIGDLGISTVLNLTNEECEILRQLEEELWREDTRFDRQRMDEVIAEDFFEFGMSGRFYTREDTLAIPRGPIDAVFPLPHFKARLLAPHVAQVTYNSAVTYDGVVYHARRSSIWSRTESGWQLRFHQGTPFDGGA